MRALVFALLLAPLAASAAGEPPLVRYAVKIGTAAWEPIAVTELEPVVEAKALSALSRGGSMRLAKSGWAELDGGDYSVTIEGRFVEDAGAFSVYLGFGRGTRDDLPSFHVAETVALEKLPRAEMQRRIEEGAARAAERLSGLLEPRLRAVRLALPPPEVEPQPTTSWGPIDIPRRSPERSLANLLDVTRPDHVRHEALASIASAAFDQPSARDALVRAMLLDPSEGVRSRAVEALAPAARAHVPTQRLVLHALRTELDEGVLGELVQLSATFPGLSRRETLETWLGLVSSEATPPAAANRIAQLLAKEDEVPNLDLAVARCLEQASLIYGKRAACAQWLLPKIPPDRRFSVVHGYLSRVRVWEQGETNAFEDVIDALAKNKNASTPLSLEIMGAMFALAERASAGRARYQAVVQLARHPAPSPAELERLVRLLYVRGLTDATLRAIGAWVKKRPELRDMSVGAIERARADAKFLVKPSHGDPYRDMDEALERLKRS